MYTKDLDVDIIDIRDWGLDVVSELLSYSGTISTNVASRQCGLGGWRLLLIPCLVK